MTAGLYWVERGDWPLAVLFYALAAVGFSGGTTFYDSLLLDVAEERDLDVVSGYGYALGYLGGGLLFLLNVVMTLNPKLFGLADAAQAVRVSFLSVALWWALFTVPLLLFVRERQAGHAVAAARRDARRVARAVADGRAPARLPRADAVPRFVLALHRRREHGHQDGRGLRAVARLRFEEPDRGAPDHAVRGVSRRARVRLDRQALRAALRASCCASACTWA